MKFIDKYFWLIIAAITIVVVVAYRKTLLPTLNIPFIDKKDDNKTANNKKDPETGLDMQKILKRGGTGPEVKALQAALNQNGASPVLTADGIFGAKTESALLLQAGVTEISLKQFQALTGIKPIVATQKKPGPLVIEIPFKPGANSGGGIAGNYLK